MIVLAQSKDISDLNGPSARNYKTSSTSFFVSNIDGDSERPNKIRLEALSSILDETGGIGNLRDGKPGPWYDISLRLNVRDIYQQ